MKKLYKYRGIEYKVLPCDCHKDNSYYYEIEKLDLDGHGYLEERIDELHSDVKEIIDKELSEKEYRVFWSENSSYKTTIKAKNKEEAEEKIQELYDEDYDTLCENSKDIEGTIDIFIDKEIKQ